MRLAHADNSIDIRTQRLARDRVQRFNPEDVLHGDATPLADSAGRYAEFLSELSHAASRLADSLDDWVIHDAIRLDQLTFACQVYLSEQAARRTKLPSMDLKGFGVRLRAARDARQWTQQQLATRVGVTRAQISLWEAEKNYPQADKLFNLVRLLQIDAHYLLTGIKRAEPSLEIVELAQRLVRARTTDRQRWTAITALLADPAKDEAIPGAFRNPEDPSSRH